MLELDDFGEVGMNQNDAREVLGIGGRERRDIGVSMDAIEIVRFLSQFQNMTDERLACAAGIDIAQLGNAKSIIESEREQIVALLMLSNT